MKKLTSILVLVLIVGLSLSYKVDGQVFNPGSATGSVTVKELDGAPNVSGVTTIQVTNGSLTDNGSGNVTVATAAANLTIGTSAITGGVASSFLYSDAGPVLRQVSITGLVLGNGASIPSAYAGTTCTNQVVRILSAAGVATCQTLTSAYVDTTIWTGTASSGMLKASSQGVLAAGTKGTDYVDVGTANSWTAGVKQTFAPNTTTSGLNFGSFAGDPSAPADGDAHYNSTTTLFRFRQNGAWVGLGIAAETLDLQGTFALGKSITGANSRANAFRFGDGVTPMCGYTDATLGPMVRPCTDANSLAIIASTFQYKIWDEGNAKAMLIYDPAAIGAGSGQATMQTSEQFVASNLGIEFNESDTNPACAAGNYTVYADTSEAIIKQCRNGVRSAIGPNIVRKTANETVNNSNTRQNDDELLFSVETNSFYTFTAVVNYSSSTAGDFNINFSLPASATGQRYDTYVGSSTTSCLNQFAVMSSQSMTTSNNNIGGAGVGTTCTLTMTGNVTTAGTSGTVQFQWAQATADATNTVVNADSYIIWQKL